MTNVEDKYPELERRIHEVLIGTFGLKAEAMTPNAELGTDLGLDSIDLFDLVGLLEKEYGVQLELGDFKGVTTLSSLIERISALVGNTATAADLTPVS